MVNLEIPVIRKLIITVTLIALVTVSEAAAIEADVIVYGSTPGGFCAAIAATREGASVILLEPTDHVRRDKYRWTESLRLQPDGARTMDEPIRRVAHARGEGLSRPELPGNEACHGSRYVFHR